jgi:hypothetical protein
MSLVKKKKGGEGGMLSAIQLEIFRLPRPVQEAVSALPE